MPQAYVDPDHLERFAGKLGSFVHSVDEVCQSLQAALQQLSSTWRDQEYEQFVEAFLQLQKSLEELSSEIERVHPKLRADVDFIRSYLESKAYFASTSSGAASVAQGSSPIVSAALNAGEGAATASGAPEGRQEEETDCRRCGGIGWISSVGSFNPEHFEIRHNPDHKVPCPSCGGTGKKSRQQMHLLSSENREAVGISETPAASAERAQGSVGDKETPVGGVSPARPRVEQMHVFYRHLPSGFRWIPLEEIEIDEGSLSLEKVHEKEQILSRFPDILEPLQALLYEQRLDVSLYFRRLDRQAGVPYAEGLQRVFDTFFGSDPIHLSRGPDGKWRVTNGRHRIAAARRLGWAAVLATVEGG